MRLHIEAVNRPETVAVINSGAATVVTVGVINNDEAMVAAMVEGVTEAGADSTDDRAQVTGAMIRAEVMRIEVDSEAGLRTTAIELRPRRDRR